MKIAPKNIKVVPVLLTVLVALWAFVPLVLADSDRVNDAPRTQTSANGLTVSLANPDENGPIADQNVQVLFRVVDKSGKPADGLQLTFLGVRDYSGQVDKEHNGPRDPNVGPAELKPTGKPGEYATTALFHNVGHWYFQLSGASLGGQTLTYNQRVQVNPNDNGGIRIDWIVWPSVALIVIIALLFVGTRGQVIPVPPISEDDVTPDSTFKAAQELAVAGQVPGKNGGR